MLSDAMFYNRLQKFNAKKPSPGFVRQSQFRIATRVKYVLEYEWLVVNQDYRIRMYNTC